MSEKIPEAGTYWRHYKSKGGLDHVYQVLGIGGHSETHERIVVYKPQYSVTKDSWVYSFDFALRPLSIWYDKVEYEGRKIQRFTQLSIHNISDLKLGKTPQ